MPLDFSPLSAEVTPESVKAEMVRRLTEKSLDVDTREGSYTDLLLSEAAYQIYKTWQQFGVLLVAAVPSADSGPYLDGFAAMYGMTRTEGESDEDFYQRLHAYLSEPVASGNANHYKQWARSVDGVGQAVVLPLWDGNGTVKVIVASADHAPVDAGVVTNVKNYIEIQRPIGASVTVVSVEALTLDVTATCTLEEGVQEDDVAAELKSRLEELCLSMEVGSAGTIRVSRVMAYLLTCEGVVECSEVKLNEAAENITLTVEQVPQVGTVTVTKGV